jgi:hypothetical protein
MQTITCNKQELGTEATGYYKLKFRLSKNLHIIPVIFVYSLFMNSEVENLCYDFML